ncbi:MAG: peroxidase family protein [Jatrophihabitans sp.]|uniref:peroxidase family protein n=1 Tax=Jatrophihabitans sp. TaxID=1932789 RepID=UPI003F7FEC7A
MGLTDTVTKLVNQTARTPWHQLPWLTLQLGNLALLRKDLREQNLLEPEGIRPEIDLGEVTDERRRARQPDGSFNDLTLPTMGMAGTGFGRNVPMHLTAPTLGRKGDPNPREVSNLLLARDTFKPAGIINTLAASWLQFMNHNWFFHGNGDEAQFHEVPLPAGDVWPEDTIRIRKTLGAGGCPVAHGAAQSPSYANTETHWWDGSQLYGTGVARQAEIREFVGGRIKVDAMNRLLPDPEHEGISHSGFNENWWAGLELLHTLFSLEHNAIAAALARAYPSMDDQRLFETAWLVNSALMAKIHTVDWTTTILRHPALQIGMNANWWGIQGEGLAKRVGRLTDNEALSGILGSTADHHAAPFSLTEEFVSVYRMHPLIPDDWAFHSIEDGRLLEQRVFTEIQGRGTREFVGRLGMENVWYSMGLADAGAVTLHNYPNALRSLQKINGEHVDLATLDILRDRERGIPRYNDFREALRMPRVRSFEELAGGNKQWAKEIATLYNGDLDAVDPMVGMYAEQPPKGYGFSDTAFRVFILMASRRLKSDRFFTDDFRPEVYTQLGYDWVQRTTMKDVLLRHYPDLAPALEHVDRVFAPWPELGAEAPAKANPLAALASTVQGYLPW